MDLAPAERAYLLEMRHLSRDLEGLEIFVGLTVEESAAYFAFTRPGGTDSRPGESLAEYHVRGDRYLELHRRMEQARLAVISAEHVVRTENPTRN